MFWNKGYDKELRPLCIMSAKVLDAQLTNTRQRLYQDRGVRDAARTPVNTIASGYGLGLVSAACQFKNIPENDRTATKAMELLQEELAKLGYDIHVIEHYRRQGPIFALSTMLGGQEMTNMLNSSPYWTDSGKQFQIFEKIMLLLIHNADYEAMPAQLMQLAYDAGLGLQDSSLFIDFAFLCTEIYEKHEGDEEANAPTANDLQFKVNELIVYPTHGIGRIVQIEEQEIGGVKLELYVIDFEKEKLRLKVPTSKSEQKGMRKLADKRRTGE